MLCQIHGEECDGELEEDFFEEPFSKRYAAIVIAKAIEIIVAKRGLSVTQIFKQLGFSRSCGYKYVGLRASISTRYKFDILMFALWKIYSRSKV